MDRIDLGKLRKSLIYKCNNISRWYRLLLNCLSALTLMVWWFILGIITGVGHTIRLLTDSDYNK